MRPGSESFEGPGTDPSITRGIDNPGFVGFPCDGNTAFYSPFEDPRVDRVEFLDFDETEIDVWFDRFVTAGISGVKSELFLSTRLLVDMLC